MQICLKKYENRNFGKPIEKENLVCPVCSNEKPVEAELIIPHEDRVIKLCSIMCMGAFKFGHGYTNTFPCDLCSKESVIDKNSRTGSGRKIIYYSGKSNQFCSEACQNVFVMKTREIVPCSWCKVRKYNFDMIEKFRDGIAKHYCSINCLRLQQGSGGTTVPQNK